MRLVFKSTSIIQDSLVADWATLLAFQPLVDALGVVLVRAPGQFLELLAPLEILEAYRAGVLAGVAPLEPRRLLDALDLGWSQTLAHLTISVLELQELFVGHIVSVRIVRVSVTATRFYCLLQ